MKNIAYLIIGYQSALSTMKSANKIVHVWHMHVYTYNFVLDGVRDIYFRLSLVLKYWLRNGVNHYLMLTAEVLGFREQL